jgi:1-deoxy-D-xylulose-5-phosphate reductoisomerase
MTVRQIALIGSTGSIGRSTLEVVRASPERFQIDCLFGGRQGETLAEQVRAFSPRVAGMSDPDGFRALCESLGVSPGAARWRSTELVCGDDAIVAAISESRATIVVAAVVGMAGLSGVLAAITSGKDIALANKESLVVAGELVMRRAREKGVSIIPVDSEHSAIFQVLQGSPREDIDSIILTASGGPFLHTPIDEFGSITAERALRHPKWNMGAKISIDSATMMNKALEVIEARWLFDLPARSIEVIVHPQSVIHSMIRLVDGSLLAQLSHPDMKGPIGYALTYPGPRVSGVMDRLNLSKTKELTFLEMDNHKFPGVERARECLEGANGAPAVLNAANEVAVELFLNKATPFESINVLVGEALSVFGDRNYSSIEELFALTEEVAGWTRQYAVGIRKCG